MSTEAQKRAVLKYDSVNTTQLHFKLNNKTDADILAWLGSLDNVQGYIKRLIRDDIDRNRSQNGSQKITPNYVPLKW